MPGTHAGTGFSGSCESSIGCRDRYTLDEALAWSHIRTGAIKRFAYLRDHLDIERPRLVFHSTRKWFITQCERTGVPEHWTASLVGHKSARSENGITYGIYSAGISDEQKREIVEAIRLPC